MNDCNSAVGSDLEITHVFQCVCEYADVESTDNVDQLSSIIYSNSIELTLYVYYKLLLSGMEYPCSFSFS